MKEEWVWKTSDNVDIQAWSSTVLDAKASIVIVHGQGEHSGRYAHITKAMNDAGINVFSYDQRGHGRSGFQRGHIPSYDQLLADLDNFVDQIRLKIDGLPLFIYGQSMGGNVALNYAFRSPDKIKAVAVSSPWIRLAFEPPAFKVFLAKAIDRIAPAMSLASGLEIKALSRDPLVCENYKNDPLNHDQITARMYNHLYSAGLRLLDPGLELRVPVYIYHGTADRLTSHDASAEFARKSNGLATFRSWDGYYHETHNDPDGNVVIAALVDWFLSKI